jgi:hypothetical protein
MCRSWLQDKRISGSIIRDWSVAVKDTAIEVIKKGHGLLPSFRYSSVEQKFYNLEIWVTQCVYGKHIINELCTRAHGNCFRISFNWLDLQVRLYTEPGDFSSPW